jgi:hypothetical protein
MERFVMIDTGLSTSASANAARPQIWSRGRFPKSFSLRALLLIFAILTSLVAYCAHRVRSQRCAVEALRAAGAIVVYDYVVDRSGTVISDQDAQPPPSVLRNLFGTDFVDDVGQVVVMRGKQFGNRDIAHIGYLPKLWSLYAADSAVDDQAIANLPVFPEMRHLNLVRCTQFGPAGLAPFRCSLKMEVLSVSGSRIDDASLACLRGMPNLKSLDISDTRVTSRGMAELAGLKSLTTVLLNGVSIDDDSLRHLSGMQALRLLELRNTPIGDAGLVHLAGLRSLRHLVLRGTKVTGRGLESLAELPQLETLSLGETPLDDQGLLMVCKLKSLRQLYIDRTCVTFKGMLVLSTLPQLERLDAFGVPLTEDDASAIRELKRWPALRELVFWAGQLRRKTVHALWVEFQRNGQALMFDDKPRPQY